MRKLYGSHPLHLLGHVAVFALSAYAIVQIFTLGAAGNAMVWLIGAVLVHDAILWPLYSGADGVGRRLIGPGAINHVRVPLGLSLLLLVVFSPEILGKGANAYRNASGETYDGYVTRWLAVTAAMFALSAVIFIARRRRA